jgi:hypothetical protein
MMEFDTLSSSYGAIRQRRHRQRVRRGRKVLRVEVRFHKFVEALLEAGLIDEDAALDDKNVEFCAGQVLDEWARRWQK